jgi:hypothetical protein
MRRTTFNPPADEHGFLKKAEEARDYVLNDIRMYQYFAYCENEDEFREQLREEIEDGNFSTFGEIRDAINWFNENGPFHYYGLCFDYVEPGTFGQREGYYRFQICWGGPGYQINFYLNGDIEFDYYEWASRVTWDISSEEGIGWLKEYFQESMNQH